MPGSTLGSRRSPGEGNGNPLHYSCLGNPMDRGAWQATVHGLPKSQTRLSYWTTTTCVCVCVCITKSLSCTAEIHPTLHQLYFNKIFKNGQEEYQETPSGLSGCQIYPTLSHCVKAVYLLLLMRSNYSPSKRVTPLLVCWPLCSRSPSEQAAAIA